MGNNMSTSAMHKLMTPESEEEAEEKKAFITFQILDEIYALPVENVRYSLKVEKITPVPDVPSFILGITNVLGEIISVIDISDFIFHKPVPLSNNIHFLLLIQWENIHTSFLVTDLLDMVFWTKSEIKKGILPLSNQEGDFFSGGTVWREKVVGVLNLKKIFSSEKMSFKENKNSGDKS